MEDTSIPVNRWLQLYRFCNRHAELMRIRNALQTAGARLLIYGDRRLGKSPTIIHQSRRLRDGYG
jgi:AAA+ ATPase superfamily predicted ATPase